MAVSTMNILYPTKSIIKSIIENIFERTYNQLPLTDIEYPFAVFELTLMQNCPGSKIELLIDLWNNDLKLNEFTLLIDRLINKLDRINNLENNLDVHFNGEIEIVRDVQTQEENLNRIQLIGLYDIYKSG